MYESGCGKLARHSRGTWPASPFNDATDKLAAGTPKCQCETASCTSRRRAVVPRVLPDESRRREYVVYVNVRQLYPR